MNVLKHQMFSELAHKLYDFSDDDDYVVTEVYDLEQSPSDKYARIGLWMYLQSDSEDYFNITIYVSESEEFGIIEELNVQHLDGHSNTYYWLPITNKLYTALELEILESESYGLSEE